MDYSGRDVQFLRHEAVDAEPRIVDTSARRLTANEGIEAGDRRIQVDTQSSPEVDGAIVTETTEALQK